jgi:hypothetical protein
LFAQVLYGRALYTSSVLIGVYWIAIVPTLILVYWLLYKFSARLDQGKSAWWVGLIAWLLAGGVARMLSTNMTLMLRPEAWHGMYSASAMGAFLPTGDPTLTPRWLLMMAGDCSSAGLWLVYLSGAQHLYRGRKDIRCRAGRQGGCRLWNCLSGRGTVGGERAADVVKAGLAGHSPFIRLYKFAGFAGYGWIALVVVAVLVGAIAGFGKDHGRMAELDGRSGGVLVEIMLTVYRDGVRDVTLLIKGYDVWDRAVATNWGVVGLFLVLFVAGLGVIGWLVSVVARAQKTMEGAA